MYAFFSIDHFIKMTKATVFPVLYLIPILTDCQISKEKDKLSRFPTISLLYPTRQEAGVT